MALHWENPAFTTPGLTPRPQNRPLKIGKLTPCKNPGVAGSAGHCEPGVGRFTDPYPLTCSFFTSPFCWLMFWLCALPSALSKSVLLVEENSAFHRAQSHASIRCPCRPSWACFFLFLPIPQFFSATSLSGGEISFLSPGGVGRCPRIRPQLAHTAPTGPVMGIHWCRSPIWLSKSHTGPYTGFFAFPLYLFHFSPTGKSRSELASVLLCPPEFVHNCPTRLQRAGNPSYWCRFPTRPTKPHTGPHRAEFGFHRLFLVRFGSGRVDKSFSSL